MGHAMRTRKTFVYDDETSDAEFIDACRAGLIPVRARPHTPENGMSPEERQAGLL